MLYTTGSLVRVRGLEDADWNGQDIIIIIIIINMITISIMNYYTTITTTIITTISIIIVTIAIYTIVIFIIIVIIIIITGGDGRPGARRRRLHCRAPRRRGADTGPSEKQSNQQTIEQLGSSFGVQGPPRNGL